MLKLALQGDARFGLDERELAPTATGYTVDTLKALRVERPGDELYLLLGADQLAAFDRWREPAEVARLARLAVFSRPGFAPAKGQAIEVPMEPMAISASDIRACASRGERLDALVPPAVANYIAAQRLYR